MSAQTVNFESGTNDGTIGTTFAGLSFFTAEFGTLTGQANVNFAGISAPARKGAFFEQIGQQSPSETLYLGSGTIPPYGFNYTTLDDTAAASSSNTFVDQLSTSTPANSEDGLTAAQRTARVGNFIARNTSFTRDSHVIQNTTGTPWSNASLDIIDIDGSPDAVNGGEQFTVDAYLNGALQFSVLTPYVPGGQTCALTALCGNRDSTSYDGQLYGMNLEQTGKTFDTIVVRFAGAPGNALKTTNTVGIVFDNLSVTPVPEPSTYAMLLAGVGVLGLMARRGTKRV